MARSTAVGMDARRTTRVGETSSRGLPILTIQDELFDQVEELNCSLRELTDYELVDCRQALINRTHILMGLVLDLEQDS